MSIIKNFIHRKKTDGLLDIKYHPQTNKNQVVGLLDTDGFLDPALNPSNNTIKQTFNPSFSTLYKEFLFTNGIISSVEYYEDATKTNHLFTKIITFAGESIDTVIVTDHTTGKEYTKTFLFSNGDIVSITENIV